MTQEQVIQTYEALSALSGRMLEAARGQEWDRLVELEHECRQLVQALQQAAPEALDPRQRERKAQLIRKLLADDTEIRMLTVGWMAQLEQLLGANSRERALRRAYGEGG